MDLYLSRPGVAVPKVRFSNDHILARVKQQYRGSDDDWLLMKAAIERVFAVCNSKYRHLDLDMSATPATYAVQAAQHCLEVNGAGLEDVDVVISGSIARAYYEPATAMEIAARLGIKRTHALDVTAACVGHLEAIQVASAYLKLHERYRTALVCTSEVYRDNISYDLQRITDLYMKSAGLTVGNGAACFLLRKAPWPQGGARILDIETYSAPDHWELCRAPIRGTFESSSVELLRLGKEIPGWVARSLARVGWTPNDVAHYVLHQPSDSLVREAMQDLGVDPERAIFSHSKYGNTATASVGLAFDQLLQEREVKPGDKLLLASAAAGFTYVAIMAEWT